MVIGKCTDVSGKDFFGWGEVFEEREPSGKIFPWKNLSWGKKNSMKGANDFRALFEKRKINMKKFFQLKVRNSIKNLK